MGFAPAKLSLILAGLAASVAVTLPTAVDAQEMGSVAGTVWNDANGDAERQPNELGVLGWKVFVDLDGDGAPGAGEQWTVTAADGTYLLDGLTAGGHVLALAAKANWQLTDPGAGGALDPLLGARSLEFGAKQRVQSDGGDLRVKTYSVPLAVDWNIDGLLDLLVGEKDGFTGKVRVYLNQGTAGAPLFKGFAHIASAGTPLEVGALGCLGAFPRLVDWDGDGLDDLLIGMANGTIRLYPNTGSKTVPQFGLPQLVQSGPAGAEADIDVGDRATPVMADWNGDANPDLLVGAMDGRVWVYTNQAVSGPPEFGNPSWLQDGGSDLVVPGLRSSPDIADLNGDGRRDVLLGNTDGELRLYANIGSDDAPTFDGHVLLEEDGHVIGPGNSRSRPSVVDWDGDGLTDILNGGIDGYVRLYLRRPAKQPSARTVLVEDGQARSGIDFGVHHDVPPPTALALTPDTGSHPADAVTSATDIVVSGMVSEPGLQIALREQTTSTALGVTAAKDGAFALPVTLEPGFRQIRATATDAFGNLSAEVLLDIVIDRQPPAGQLDFPAPATTIGADRGYVEVCWTDTGGAGIDPGSFGRTDIDVSSASVTRAEPLGDGRVRYWYAAGRGYLGNGNVDVTFNPAAVVDLAGNATLEASAAFTIDTAGVFALRLGQGWNCFSLPREPAQSTVGDLLCGIPLEGFVWELVGDSFQPVHRLHPKRAYWGCVAATPGTPEVVTVEITGPLADDGNVDLLPGWNGVGPLTDVDPPGALEEVTEDILRVVAGQDMYLPLGAAEKLVPGLGYLFFAREKCTVDLGEPAP